MDWLSVVIIGGSLAGVGGGIAWLWHARLSREATDTHEFGKARAENRHIPVSLHPLIAPGACTGCLNCIKACPEGDILGIVDGVAQLISATECVGHGRCAEECPTGAIRLVFGSSERGVDLPQLGDGYSSSRAGVHIVGELGGMGLIRNAVTQGVQVVEHLSHHLQRRESEKNVYDVAIVGAGPAGLATAATCKANRISYVLVEQDTLGGTIAHYPRQKIVMTEPVELPKYGKFGASTISKEELLETWQDVVNTMHLKVNEKARVEDIQGDDQNFSMITTRGTVQARKVVLAMGRRGTPRKLDVPGEDLPKVTYRMIDPEQYMGQSVLVVGGGDSAVEAAIMLAEQTDARVAISYRSNAFSRCKPKNRERIDQLIGHERVTAYFNSEVEEILVDHVTLKGDKPQQIANDFVFINVGGQLPTEFLSKVGVEVRTHRGDQAQPLPSRSRAKNTAAQAAVERAKSENQMRRRIATVLLGLGFVVVAVLLARGWNYYPLPRIERLHHPLHKTLRASGTWGHGVGIVATAVMLMNFLYSARKRWKMLHGRGSIRTWLTFHMCVGIISPVVILFHSAFLFNNVLAVATTVSLAIVVMTGIIGRYIYGMIVKTHAGTPVEYERLKAQWESAKARVQNMGRRITNSPRLTEELLKITELPKDGSLRKYVTHLPIELAQGRYYLSQAKEQFSDRDTFIEFQNNYLELLRLRRQLSIQKSVRSIMAGWRVFHVVLSLFLVVVIAAHIGVSLYLGYWWILPKPH